MKRPSNDDFSTGMNPGAQVIQSFSSSFMARKLLLPASTAGHHEPFIANMEKLAPRRVMETKLYHPRDLNLEEFVCFSSRNSCHASSISPLRSKQPTKSKVAKRGWKPRCNQAFSRKVHPIGGNGVGRPLPPAPKLFMSKSPDSSFAPNVRLGEIKTFSAQKRSRSWFPSLERNRKRAAVHEQQPLTHPEDHNLLDAAVALSAMAAPSKINAPFPPHPSALPPPPGLRFCPINPAR